MQGISSREKLRIYLKYFEKYIRGIYCGEVMKIPLNFFYRQFNYCKQVSESLLFFYPNLTEIQRTVYEEHYIHAVWTSPITFFFDANATVLLPQRDEKGWRGRVVLGCICSGGGGGEVLVEMKRENVATTRVHNPTTITHYLVSNHVQLFVKIN